MKRKVWMFVGPKKIKYKPSEEEKNEISDKCQPIVEVFKKQYIKEDHGKSDNYCVDVYTGWYQNFIYFIEKYKSESPNRIKDEFEHKFVRLEYKGNDSFNFSFFRHTGQWWLVVEDVSLEECFKMMKENPNFRTGGMN